MLDAYKKIAQTAVKASDALSGSLGSTTPQKPEPPKQPQTTPFTDAIQPETGGLPFSVAQAFVPGHALLPGASPYPPQAPLGFTPSVENTMAIDPTRSYLRQPLADSPAYPVSPIGAPVGPPTADIPRMGGIPDTRTGVHTFGPETGPFRAGEMWHTLEEMWAAGLFDAATNPSGGPMMGGPLGAPMLRGMQPEALKTWRDLDTPSFNLPLNPVQEVMHDLGVGEEPPKMQVGPKGAAELSFPLNWVAPPAGKAAGQTILQGAKEPTRNLIGEAAELVVKGKSYTDEVMRSVSESASSLRVGAEKGLFGEGIKSMVLAPERGAVGGMGDMFGNWGAVLPKELSGAKPRYSYGKKQFTLEFANDVDKAAYITAQAAKSKVDDRYLQFVIENTGMTESEVRIYGKSLKDSIKPIAKTSQSGETIKVALEGATSPTTSKAVVIKAKQVAESITTVTNPDEKIQLLLNYIMSPAYKSLRSLQLEARKFDLSEALAMWEKRTEELAKTMKYEDALMQARHETMPGWSRAEILDEIPDFIGSLKRTLVDHMVEKKTPILTKNAIIGYIDSHLLKGKALPMEPGAKGGSARKLFVDTFGEQTTIKLESKKFLGEVLGNTPEGAPGVTPMTAIEEGTAVQRGLFPGEGVPNKTIPGFTTGDPLIPKQQEPGEWVKYTTGRDGKKVRSVVKDPNTYNLKPGEEVVWEAKPRLEPTTPIKPLTMTPQDDTWIQQTIESGREAGKTPEEIASELVGSGYFKDRGLTRDSLTLEHWQQMGFKKPVGAGRTAAESQISFDDLQLVETEGVAGLLIEPEKLTTIAQKARDLGWTTLDFGNFMRANLASADFSGYRQLMPLIAANPKETLGSGTFVMGKGWLYDVGAGVTGLAGKVTKSDKAHNWWVETLGSKWSTQAINKQIQSHPMYALYDEVTGVAPHGDMFDAANRLVPKYQKAGSGRDFLRGLLGQKDAFYNVAEDYGILAGEGFFSNVANKLPWIKYSGNAHTNLINKATFDIWVKECYNTIPRHLRQGMTDMEKASFIKNNKFNDADKLARAIADMSGRGGLYQAADASRILNAFLFSARLQAGRVMTPRNLVSSSGATRKFALKNIGAFLTSASSALWLGQQAGLWEVNWDDFHKSDWLKAKVGNTYIDVLGGYQQWARLFAEMGTIPGSEIPEKLYRFGWTKSAPQASLVMDARMGENVVGQEFDISDPMQWLQRFAPLAPQGIVEAIFGEGGSPLAASTEMIGFGAATYRTGEQKVDDLKDEIALRDEGVAFEDLDPSGQRRVNTNPEVLAYEEEAYARDPEDKITIKSADTREFFNITENDNYLLLKGLQEAVDNKNRGYKTVDGVREVYTEGNMRTDFMFAENGSNARKDQLNLPKYDELKEGFEDRELTGNETKSDVVRYAYYDLLDRMRGEGRSYDWVLQQLEAVARIHGMSVGEAREAIREYTEIGKQWPQEYLDYRRRERGGTTTGYQTPFEKFLNSQSGGYQTPYEQFTGGQQMPPLPSGTMAPLGTPRPLKVGQ